MHDGCISVRIDLSYILSLRNSPLVLESFLYLLKSFHLSFFCDYINDCYIIVLIDT
jgi:hypothetical protein